MAINFWNNVNPSSVSFSLNHNPQSYAPPPLNNPLPNWMLRPGFTPQLPPPAIPANPGNIKAAISKLPSIFSIKFS